MAQKDAFSMPDSADVDEHEVESAQAERISGEFAMQNIAHN